MIAKTADEVQRNDCQSLKVVAWNLCHGGRDGELREDYARLWKQVEALSQVDADLVALQEAKWGSHSNKLLHEVAYRLGMPVRFLIPSRNHGSHLAMFVRERPGLRVAQERHSQVPYWHALGHLELKVGDGGTLHFVNAHFAPTARTQRLIEAESLGLLADRPAIVAGDFNAVPATSEHNESSDLTHPKLDQRPAQALQDAGFTDVAAHLGVVVPTVVDFLPRRFAYRCDRILSTLPTHTYDSATVGEFDPLMSDHAMITASFHIHPSGLVWS